MPGLVGPGFRWFGDRVKAEIGKEIDRRQLAAGRAIVARARQLAPVRTGQLRAGIDFTYRQDTHTLQIHSDSGHGFFVEFGTRFMVAQPHLRPALAEFGRFWGISELHFPEIRTPGTIPMPRANAAAITRRDVINRKVEGKFRLRRRPRVVFHGRTSKSLQGYKPPYESRYE